jgi:bacterioferritin
VDQEEFTDLLNEDLSTEYQSIVQYNLHISTVTGPEFVSTIDELIKHLAQELNHARVLAAQV